MAAGAITLQEGAVAKRTGTEFRSPSGQNLSIYLLYLIRRSTSSVCVYDAAARIHH